MATVVKNYEKKDREHNQKRFFRLLSWHQKAPT